MKREQQLAYRALKVRFQLDDDYLKALQDELIYAKRLAVDEAGRVLVWTGAAPALRPDVLGTAAQEQRNGDASLAIPSPS